MDADVTGDTYGEEVRMTSSETYEVIVPVVDGEAWLGRGNDVVEILDEDRLFVSFDQFAEKAELRHGIGLRGWESGERWSEALRRGRCFCGA